MIFYSLLHIYTCLLCKDLNKLKSFLYVSYMTQESINKKLNIFVVTYHVSPH